MKYVDSCISYEVLLQDSGLAEKPNPNWNTFTPKKGDLALVKDKEYEFDGKEWKLCQETKR